MAKYITVKKNKRCIVNPYFQGKRYYAGITDTLEEAIVLRNNKYLSLIKTAKFTQRLGLYFNYYFNIKDK